jgi:predicted transcriptional regulator
LSAAAHYRRVTAQSAVPISSGGPPSIHDLPQHDHGSGGQVVTIRGGRGAGTIDARHPQGPSLGEPGGRKALAVSRHTDIADGDSSGRRAWSVMSACHSAGKMCGLPGGCKLPSMPAGKAFIGGTGRHPCCPRACPSLAVGINLRAPHPFERQTNVADDLKSELIELTAGIAAAYVENNSVAAGDLPALIHSIHQALKTVEEPAAAVEAPKTPAVSIKKSLGDDYLICLEDGRSFKSLKRHLRTKYNLSPEDYRAKWGLPKSYPMVAPSYATARSVLAKKIGLGQGGRGAAKVKPAPRGRAKAVVV